MVIASRKNIIDLITNRSILTLWADACPINFTRQGSGVCCHTNTVYRVPTRQCLYLGVPIRFVIQTNHAGVASR